jgi:tRNA dimethylallyltransferase
VGASNRLDTLLAGGVHALVGPTASGKSALALAVAEAAGAEIVALDSMQVYRRMDVGTAKPTRADRARVRHHMLDLVEPHEEFDVTRFLAALEPVLADAAAREKRVLFVGGTGFYLKVVLDRMFDGPPVDRALRAELEARAAAEGPHALHAELARVDAVSAARIDARDAKRVVRALEVFAQTGKPLSEWQREWRTFAPDAAPGRPRRLVGLELPVADLDARIRDRTRAMLAAGWAEEALAIERGGGFSRTSIQALGYRAALEHAHGRAGLEATVAAIALATRQFARRQRTWYRKFPEIEWLPAADAPRNDSAEDARVGTVLRALGWERA